MYFKDERDLVDYAKMARVLALDANALGNRKGAFPQKVIFNDPATIVLWNDGTKTVVKCSENDIYDPEKGLAMAVSKKYFESIGLNYRSEFRKHCREYKKEDIDIIAKIPMFEHRSLMDEVCENVTLRMSEALKKIMP